MASGGQKFRSSVSGFNKKDVTAYIQKLNAEMALRDGAAKEQLSLKDGRIAQQESELERLKAELAEALSRAEELEKAQSENAALREENERLVSELEAAPKLTEAELRVLEEKAAMYDNMSSQLGEIMINANKTADSIVKDANIKAEGIIKTASEAAGAIKETMMKRAEKITGELRGAVKTISQDYCDELVLELTRVRDQVSQSIISVAGKSDQITERSAALKRRIDEETEAVLERMEKEASSISVEGRSV